MKMMAFGCLCALLLSGCATERYGVSVSGTRSDWVAVRIDRVTGEACYTEQALSVPWTLGLWPTWTPIREKGKTGEQPDTAAMEASSRHKAEMAKMTNEQLKSHLRDLREKYHSAGHQSKQALDALSKKSPSPFPRSMPSWEMETDQAVRNIEAQAALEWAEKEEHAIIPTLNEAESAYKKRLHAQFKASQHLPAN